MAHFRLKIFGKKAKAAPIIQMHIEKIVILLDQSRPTLQAHASQDLMDTANFEHDIALEHLN